VLRKPTSLPLFSAYARAACYDTGIGYFSFA